VKKKAILIALVVIVVAVGVTTASLAYFRASASVTNVFIVGGGSGGGGGGDDDEPTLDITLLEQMHDGEKLVPFEQDQMFIPVLDDSADALRDDPNYVEKLVSLYSEKKSVDSYVRLYLALPKNLDDGGILKTDLDNPNDTWVQETDKDGNAVLAVVTRGGVDYNVYAYLYTAVLSAESETDVLLRGVYLSPETNRDGDMLTLGDATAPVNDASNAQVLVAAEAAQASGFSSAAAAVGDVFYDFSKVTAMEAVSHFTNFWPD